MRAILKQVILQCYLQIWLYNASNVYQVFISILYMVLLFGSQ